MWRYTRETSIVDSKMDVACPIQAQLIASSKESGVVQLMQNDRGYFVWSRRHAQISRLLGPIDTKEQAEGLFAEEVEARRRDMLFALDDGEKNVGSFHDVPIARVKAFWNARPCNLRHGTAPQGTKEWFDQVEARKYRVEPHIPEFAAFHAWKGMHVLEVGCGLGTELTNFARAGARVVAVDVSDESAALARKRLEVFGLEGTVLVGDAERLSDELQHGLGTVPSFDLVWSFGVIHHTPNPAKAIAEIHRVLKPGGQLRMMVYAKISFKLLFLMRETGQWDFSREAIDRLLARHSEAQSGCPVTYSYTEDDIRTTVLPAGEWDVESVTQDHIFSFDIPAYIQHEYKKAEEWANVAPEDFRQFEKSLGWHLLVKARKRSEKT